MKIFRFVLPLLFVGTVSFGQSNDITEEDLRKYAITMDSVDGMKETLTEIITTMVQTNTVMSVQRYNELFKFTGDSTKLSEMNVTPEETAFLREVAEKREDEIARINANYQALAKEYVGLKAFNAIRKQLQTDEELKSRYEAISKEIDNEASTKGDE